MELLATMRNNNAEMDYTLVKVRYSDLRERVLATLSDVVIGTFDSMSVESAANEYNAENNKKKYDTMRVRHVSYGIETSFFVVSEDDAGTWRLIDGFRRLFGNGGIDRWMEYEVLVKVYKNVDVKGWTRLIHESNTWKSYSEYFDRGFRLSMYQHFGIDLKDDSSDLMYSAAVFEAYTSMFTSIYDLRPNLRYALVDNEFFAADIAVLNEFSKTHITFRKKTKTGYDIVSKPVARYSHLLLDLVGATLGTFREDYESTETLTLDMLMEILHEEKMSALFYKVMTISIPGFAKKNFGNNVHGALTDAFKERLIK